MDFKGYNSYLSSYVSYFPSFYLPFSGGYYFIYPTTYASSSTISYHYLLLTVTKHVYFNIVLIDLLLVDCNWSQPFLCSYEVYQCNETEVNR